MPVPLRLILLGTLGAALAGGSLIAQSYVSGGAESSADQTKICVAGEYSVQDGCREQTRSMTQMQFGRAYVVTDAGDGRAGVDQYELHLRNANGSDVKVGQLSLSTSKVPRYVLGLEDIDGRHGPPKPGRYELVTVSAGQQASYLFTITKNAT